MVLFLPYDFPKKLVEQFFNIFHFALFISFSLSSSISPVLTLVFEVQQISLL
jgi:hypothetical protein